MMKLIKWTVLFGVVCLSQQVAAQHDQPSPDYKTIKVRDHLYMLQGKGGNVAVSIGSDGVLLVDDGYSEMTPALNKALSELAGESHLKFILNTHWHGDHTGGNKNLSDHAHIIAHHNVRKRLSSRQNVKELDWIVEASPAEALPVITFGESISVHFNGQEIKVQHLGKGHTDGDSVVYFTGINVVHTGDLYFQGTFPFIDLSSGGDVRQFVASVKKVIDSIREDTRVIPGHGDLSSKKELQSYYEMLLGSIETVKAMKAKGLSLKAAQEEGLPERFAKWGDGFIKSDAWVKKLYTGLD